MSLSPFLSHFSVNVYNPLGRVVSWSVRLPVDGTAYTVSDASGNTVDSQVCVCVGCICLSVCVCICLCVFVVTNCPLCPPGGPSVQGNPGHPHGQRARHQRAALPGAGSPSGLHHLLYLPASGRASSGSPVTQGPQGHREQGRSFFTSTPNRIILERKKSNLSCR